MSNAKTEMGTKMRMETLPVRAPRFARVAGLLAAALLVMQLGAAGVAWAEDDSSKDEPTYSSREAGHPLRIAAYALHPVGVILDTLIVRPAHWLGSREPIKSLVGNKD